MPITTIQWVGDTDGFIRAVDQTLLPEGPVYVDLETVDDVWDAIKRLVVRGAPAIGCAAALGVALSAKRSADTSGPVFVESVLADADYLATSRPTAVNLFWAIERMKKVVKANRHEEVGVLRRLILSEAQKVVGEDREICRRIGENGAHLITDGDNVVTHCNAGGLATAEYGTALAVMFVAHERGRRFTVYADETRPLLQGARITALELREAGIDCRVICDGMAGWLMRRKNVGLVIVGADRIAANGDAANKIGTYSLSVLAREHGVPFYVAAPFSTFDLSLATGDAIPIEERDEKEITMGFGRRTVPEGVGVWNPAFDVTPRKNITGIITEKGVIEHPDAENIRDFFSVNG